MASYIMVVLIIIGLASQVKSETSTHRYKKGDLVPLYANKIGPFRNPSEVYGYYNLPFCSTDHVEKKGSLSEMLSGHRLVSVRYKLEFLVDKEFQVLCRKVLTKEEVSRFRKAVEKNYYLQMYYDDLPIWAFVGKYSYDYDQSETSKPIEHRFFIYRHVHFDIFYNMDRVIEINFRPDPNLIADVTIDKEVDVEFSYSVTWKQTYVPFEKRMEMYTQSAILPRHLEIHRFSIMNSSVTTLFLFGGLVAIYRVIKRDIEKDENDEELSDNHEESGWKSLHRDVFRYPNNKSLFAASIGSGTQLLTVAISIIILGLIGVFHPYDRGVLLVALIISYLSTSGIAGFTAVSFYSQLEGSEWVRNLLMTGCLCSVPLLLTFFFVNTVSLVYGSISLVPSRTVLLLLSLWIFLALPLLFFGGLFGDKMKSKFEAPCRTTKCPREIPRLRWYRGVVPQMALSGLLPFSVLYIQLYYIFASVWGHRIYTLYSILSIVFILLLIVTALVSVTFTYFQLRAEDHEWWWRSFLCGGSTGLYVYGYCFYYYYFRSDMEGFMQTSFLFGYMACICFGIFLMLGTVAFQASSMFVRYIYGSIKAD